MIHLGVEVKEKPTNHINKETYLAAKPEGMKGWEEKHYGPQRIKAELNYDANMRYFDSLDSEKFNKFLQKKCKKHKLTECSDLNELKGIEGIYVMVLDEYKQVYVGKSSDIKKRIQGHWSKQKSLERLIFGDVKSSILSIDSFGALDTTRVFYRKCGYRSIDILEEQIVADFQGLYLCNRTAGGIGSIDTYTNDAMAAQLAVVANRQERNLEKFFDYEAYAKFVLQRSDI